MSSSGTMVNHRRSQDFSKRGGLHCVKVRVLVCLGIFKLKRLGIFATCSRLFGWKRLAKGRPQAPQDPPGYALVNGLSLNLRMINFVLTRSILFANLHIAVAWFTCATPYLFQSALDDLWILLWYPPDIIRYTINDALWYLKWSLLNDKTRSPKGLRVNSPWTDVEWAIGELKHATFLSHGRQPEVKISHARTVVSLRFLN